MMRFDTIYNKYLDGEFITDDEVRWMLARLIELDTLLSDTGERFALFRHDIGARRTEFNIVAMARGLL